MKNIILFLIIFFISGCGFKQPKISKDEQKFESPMRNKTFFTNAFQKLNRLMTIFEVPKIRIQVKPIENRTASSKLPFDIRTFIETPLVLYISNLDLIAYEPEFREKEMTVTGYRPQGIGKTLPDLVINGAITQYDKNFISNSKGLNVDVEAGKGKGATTFMGELNNDVSKSQIAIDLKVYKYFDRSYLSGIATQNKIKISKYDRSGNFGLFLNGTGLGVSKSTSFKQSEDEALRILSEYSLLQLIGKLYAIPYWKCTTPNLPIDNYVVKEDLREFNSFDKKGKIKKIEIIMNGYNAPYIKRDGKLDKIEYEELKVIKKEFFIKGNNFLSPYFYQQLFIKAPFFDNKKIDYKNINFELKSKARREDNIEVLPLDNIKPALNSKKISNFNYILGA